MPSVSNINFPCIVKLGQLNKKKIKIEYVLKEKMHIRSLSMKRITINEYPRFSQVENRFIFVYNRGGLMS